jgi:hypothetical protein
VKDVESEKRVMGIILGLVKVLVLEAMISWYPGCRIAERSKIYKLSTRLIFTSCLTYSCCRGWKGLPDVRDLRIQKSV